MDVPARDPAACPQPPCCRGARCKEKVLEFGSCVTTSCSLWNHPQTQAFTAPFIHNMGRGREMGAWMDYPESSILSQLCFEAPMACSACVSSMQAPCPLLATARLSAVCHLPCPHAGARMLIPPLPSWIWPFVSSKPRSELWLRLLRWAWRKVLRGVMAHSGPTSEGVQGEDGALGLGAS